MSTTNIGISEGFIGQKSLILPNEEVNYSEFQDQQLWITHIGYYPNAASHHKIRPKGCDEYVLIFCSGGKGWIINSGEKNIIKENMFFILPPHSPHSYGCEETNPWSIYWLHFKGKNSHLISSIEGRPIVLSSSSGSNTIRESLNLFSNIYQNLAESWKTDTLEYVNHALKYFLVSLKHQEKFQKQATLHEQDPILRCKEIMMQNLSNRLFLNKLAEEVGYSTSHLTRMFNERTGMSPISYYNRLRMEQACNYLTYSSYRIKEIAFKLGYFDQYHFSKVFHKEMGRTPRDYRTLKQEALKDSQ